MPLQRRLPKFGFKNINHKEYKAVNLGAIQGLAEKLNLTSIDPQVLFENGLVGRNDLVKVLANGSISAKVEVKAHAFSAKAVEAIEAANGSVVKL